MFTLAEKPDDSHILELDSLPTGSHSTESVSVRKKVDSKPAMKPSRSPLLPRRSLGDPPLTASSLPSTLRVRGTSNVSTDSYLSVIGSDTQQLSEDDTTDGYHTNGGSVDNMLDDVDGSTPDPNRTKAAVGHLLSKIAKTREQIKVEQSLKEENVNEYLRLAANANADKQQVQRIKMVFEKKNAKSTQYVAQLQKKLESYQKRLKEVEHFGVSSHKQAKEVLRDVGQGLRGVGANIRDGITGFSGGVVGNIKGATETIVSKPREFAYLIKNKFGSADNIRGLHNMDEGHVSTDEGDRSHPGSETLPASFKYTSDDEASIVTSGSAPSAGIHSSPHHQHHSMTMYPHMDASILPSSMIQAQDAERLFMLERDYRDSQSRMQETVESMKNQMTNDYGFLKQCLDEERYHYERLEEQINDLTELHQHEMTNLKQELSSVEEKMEYQLDERTRDMQELLETCQTRITKMELQQQQQQLISMEGLENANARALITKLINVVLAILAVLLVLVSTITNMLSPFITTRLRLITTIVLVLAVILAYQNWPNIELLLMTLTDFIKKT